MIILSIGIDRYQDQFPYKPSTDESITGTFIGKDIDENQPMKRPRSFNMFRSSFSFVLQHKITNQLLLFLAWIVLIDIKCLLISREKHSITGLTIKSGLH